MCLNHKAATELKILFSYFLENMCAINNDIEIKKYLYIVKMKEA